MTKRHINFLMTFMKRFLLLLLYILLFTTCKKSETDPAEDESGKDADRILAGSTSGGLKPQSIMTGADGEGRERSVA